MNDEVEKTQVRLFVLAMVIITIATIVYDIKVFVRLSEPQLHLYKEVYWQAYWTVVLIQYATGGLLLPLLVYEKKDSLWLSATFIGFWVLTFAIIASIFVAPYEARKAAITSWQSETVAQATYNQLETGFWVGYRVVEHTCRQSGNRSGTNCQYTQVIGAGDSKKYRPYFNYEEELFGSFWNKGLVEEFSLGRVPPPNWQSQNYSQGSVPQNFVFDEYPAEWARIKNVVDQELSVPATYIGTTTSWQNAYEWQENAREREWQDFLTPYMELGLLPNRTAFVEKQEFVQFAPSLNISEQQRLAWQETAELWSSWSPVGAQWFFADEAQVEDRFDWTAAVELYVRSETVFGDNVLTAQQAILLCTVNTQMNQVTGCNLISGDSNGNLRLKNVIGSANSVAPFTPEGFFGLIEASFVRDGALILDADGNAMPSLMSVGGSEYANLLFNSFEPPLQDSEWAKGVVVSSAKQQEIIEKAGYAPLVVGITIFGILLLLLAVLTGRNSS